MKSGPKLLPMKPLGTPRQVFLPKEMWERLKAAAKFHGEAFKALGATEGVSRNDMIQDFLSWALVEYWAQVSGEPTGPKDRATKVAAMAEILRQEQKVRSDAEK